MANRGLKYIVVEEDTKKTFDQMVSQAMMAAPRGMRVSQDYVIREMIAAYLEKLDRQKNEGQKCNTHG